jgi:hypothetical protein
MFSSLLRRSSLVAIPVLAAASAMFLAPGTATSAGPHTTSISIRAAHPAVKPGGATALNGSLRVGTGAALPGKTVTLESRLPGDTEFLPVATALSGPRGGLSVTVAPAETTRYRWVFAGDSADRGSRSGVATVKVRVPTHAATRLPATLSIRAAHPVVTVAGTDTVTGRLLSRKRPLRNKIVVLVSRATGASSWAFVGARHTARNGGVAFTVKPAAASSYRLLFQGTAAFRKARSAVVHVAIRSTALSIATSVTAIAPGGSADVTGVLTKSGAVYAGQAVQLWGKPVGSRHGFAALSASTTAPDGTVTFAVAPAKSMRYFLYFPKTSQAPAVRSTTRTLVVH